MNAAPRLGWGGVVRLGLVQASIGSVVVLMTSTLNRVMIVELGLAAAVPGALVALHFAIQFLFRPKMGHDSDTVARRTGVILLGMGLLALSGTGAAASLSLLASARVPGLVAATLAFAGIGVGVSAAGTPLLALLADRVAPERRARAAGIVWLMMIAGFVLTTVITSQLLTPFSLQRLTIITAGVGLTACVVAWLALRGLEAGTAAVRVLPREETAFRTALERAWREPSVRRFAGFVFAAMLGYSAQDLILEPFAGAVFGLSPAASTQVSSMHQGGMLLGMIVAALLAARLGGLSRWAAAGCAASTVAFVLLALTPQLGQVAFLKGAVVLLGLANGAFAIGAVGSMMVEATGEHAGLRMGIFGAAQAVAYAIGGFLGAAGSDVARAALGSASGGYTAVFLAEAVLFGVAALLVATDRRSVARPELASAEQGNTLLAALR
ncbi:MAG: BCD family MFS transporter [Gemmatimonadales bacterium]